MTKKAGGFAQKAARSRQKRDYSLVKYVKSIRSEKSGNWRFQEQIIRVNDGETVAAALKRVDLELHPEPENIPVIQPEVAAAPVEGKPVEESVVEVVEAETELEAVTAESEEPATEDKTE